MVSEPIAVLGRGTSLIRYAQFSHLFHKIYLVNPFSAEIEKLGVEHFQGKELVHVVAKGNDCRLKQNQYTLFSKITVTANIVLTTPTQPIGSYRYINFQPMPPCMNDRGFPLVGWNDITQILHKTPYLLHQQLIEQLEVECADVIAENNARAETTTRCWPTTGLFAIDLALMTDTPTVIYLFGFDCFQDGTDSYFIGKKKSHQSKDAQELMKYYLRCLVQEFTTTFRSVDEQPFTENNWEVIPPIRSPR